MELLARFLGSLAESFEGFLEVEEEEGNPKETSPSKESKRCLSSMSDVIFDLQSQYFQRDDVALENFAKFFKELSEEEREHSEKFIKYQKMRGGRVFLQDIKKPMKDEWGSGLEAMQCALELQKVTNQLLLEMHKMASDATDPHLCDFIDSYFLKESVEVIKKLGDHITSLKKVTAAHDGMGEYLFDKHSLS
ncbi:ferritin heavy chain-like [Protopterus annectens]|uniref:ferritin heavy chain-like n=1 Tax=Protopterus annectens TaxID=7888 RepID=UPI001CFB4F07|nr:ferritin heavy chain-like [Protopterus annectens]